jgi:hypothetical protein
MGDLCHSSLEAMETLDLPFVAAGVTLGRAVDLLKQHGRSALVVDQPAGAALVTTEQIVNGSKEGAQFLADIALEALTEPTFSTGGPFVKVTLRKELAIAFSVGPDICKCSSGNESHIGRCFDACAFNDGIYSP